jgi:hypothetical protein
LEARTRVDLSSTFERQATGKIKRFIALSD